MTIKAQSIFKLLITIFIILFIANIFTVYQKVINHLSDTKSAVRLFNFDIEQNIPTLFSVLILLLSSILLFHIAHSNKIRGVDFKFWRILGFVFLFLAFDEGVSIHEIIGHILTKNFNLQGYFYYSWVIPYGIVLIVFSIYLFKFLRQLPKSTLRLFIFSGCIFVMGAIVMEIIGSKTASDLGSNCQYDLTYSILYTIEESLEMIGVILFIYALLKHITLNKLSPLNINFS